MAFHDATLYMVYAIVPLVLNSLAVPCSSTGVIIVDQHYYALCAVSNELLVSLQRAIVQDVACSQNVQVIDYKVIVVVKVLVVLLQMVLWEDV